MNQWAVPEEVEYSASTCATSPYVRNAIKKEYDKAFSLHVEDKKVLAASFHIVCHVSRESVIFK